MNIVQEDMLDRNFYLQAHIPIIRVENVWLDPLRAIRVVFSKEKFLVLMYLHTRSFYMKRICHSFSLQRNKKTLPSVTSSAPVSSQK